MRTTGELNQGWGVPASVARNSPDWREAALSERGGSPSPTTRVKQKLLQMIYEVSASSLPDEFGGFLRKDRRGVVARLVVLPGTYSNERSATYNLWNRPIDYDIVGTVHSHPSSIPLPSDADLHLFERVGDFHIITAEPFDADHWVAYDRLGRVARTEIV
jgi:proteasome lid subunit RPN8/RPN11